VFRCCLEGKEKREKAFMSNAPEEGEGREPVLSPGAWEGKKGAGRCSKKKEAALPDSSRKGEEENGFSLGKERGLT